VTSSDIDATAYQGRGGWAFWAWRPGSNLRRRPLGLTAKQEPGLRGARQPSNPTHGSNAGHRCAFRVVAAGQVGRESPSPSGDPAEGPGLVRPRLDSPTHADYSGAVPGSFLALIPPIASRPRDTVCRQPERNHSPPPSVHYRSYRELIYGGSHGLESSGRKLEADQRQGQREWGKLTDDDLDVIQGRRDQLEGKIQQRYGIAKDQVKRDINDWYDAQTW
jgi:uncharacterized protein YjbJ (UPF0337 family)